MEPSTWTAAAIAVAAQGLALKASKDGTPHVAAVLADRVVAPAHAVTAPTVATVSMAPVAAAQAAAASTLAEHQHREQAGLGAVEAVEAVAIRAVVAARGVKDM
jgi:hypothetical protein